MHANFLIMNNNFTYLNGEFVPFEQSFLSVSDLSIQRGYAIFDFFLVREGIPPFLSDHLDRFIRSAALLNLDLPYTKAMLSEVVSSLIAKNGIRNSSIKMILTGGVSPDDFTLATTGTTLVVINKPFELILPDWWKNGGSLISCNYQREFPEAKTINYIRSVRWSQRLQETKAAEILYLDRNWVRECSRSNIFCVKDQIVYTPKSNILAGVTRKRILQLPGLEVRMMNFKLKDLLAADEVFITSTTKGVLPIVKIDDTTIGNGKIGSVTKAIREAILS